MNTVKKLMVGLALLLPACAMAQSEENFIIKGKVGNLNAPVRAYLLYRLGANMVRDSSAIVNGSFELNGTILFPVNASIIIDHSGAGLAQPQGNLTDGLNLYLDKGTITVTGSTDSIARAQITGSPINDDNRKVQAQLRTINDKAKKLYDRMQHATPAEQQSAEFRSMMQNGFKDLQAEQEGVLTNFIKSNPGSYLSLLALSSLGGPTADPAVLEPLYNSLAQNIKDTEPGKQLRNSINELKVTAIGTAAPDFTQNDVNGTPVKLSSFRGKYVLLDFWASWCGPCRQENPNVVKAYNRFKGKNFTVVGVSLDKPDAKASWLNAIKSDGLNWTQVSDLQYWNNAAAGLYHVTSIPQNFLIDPKGKIVAKNLRGDDLENKLVELFGKI